MSERAREQSAPKRRRETPTISSITDLFLMTLKRRVHPVRSKRKKPSAILKVGIYIAFIMACPMVLGTPRADSTKTRLEKKSTTTNSSMLTKRKLHRPHHQDSSVVVELTREDREAEQKKDVLIKKAAATKALSLTQYKDLLNRIGTLEAEPEVKKPFSLPETTPPAQTNGHVRDNQFPAIVQVPPPKLDASGPLSVIRMSPVGDIERTDTISITFSAPMVPLTGQSASVANIPVIIEPKLPGKWRWLGTHTLIFESSKQLPKASHYTVTIPKTWSSLTGQTFEKNRRFKFSTNRPKVVRSGPASGPSKQTRQPWLYFKFDQDVVATEVEKRLYLTKQSKRLAIVRATAAQTKTISASLPGFEMAEKKRWFIFRPATELASNTSYTASLRPGIASLEGPRLSNQTFTFSFRTYPPMTISRFRCGYRKTCYPTSSMVFNFSNPIEAETVTSGTIQIQPPVKELETQVHHNRLIVSGVFQGGKSYKLTVSRAIADIYGQQLKTPYLTRVQVEDAPPRIQIPGRRMVVLEPAAKGVFSIFSLNVESIEYELYKVTPKDWPAYKNAMRSHARNRMIKTALPGTSLGVRHARPPGPTGRLSETPITLRPALNGGYGHVVLRVRNPKGDHHKQPHDEYRWIQITDIGIDVAYDHETLMVWVNQLKDGRPIANAEVRLGPDGQTGATKPSGLVNLALPDPTTSAGFVEVKSGQDMAFLPENASFWHNRSDWTKRRLKTSYRWHHFTDRHLYKPGEKVKTKGWIRRHTPGQKGGLAMPSLETGDIAYSIIGPRGNALGKGRARLNTWGGFEFDFIVPKDAHLGLAKIQLKRRLFQDDIANPTHTTAFQIEEFRRPEYEVSATIESGPFFIKDAVQMTTKANYYAGGPLADAGVNWRVSACSASFRPPNTDGFSFGPWQPWWKRPQSDQCYWQGNKTGQTDSMGLETLAVKLSTMKVPMTIAMTAEATVIDVNRQAFATEKTWLVHPASHYVGLKTDTQFVSKGDPIELDMVVFNVDGHRLENRTIRATATHLKWVRQGRRWLEKDGDTQSCRVQSKARSQRCTFRSENGGRYRIDATVIDGMGRKNQSTRYIWVTGGRQIPKRILSKDALTLIPSKEKYKPGEVAKITVLSPFWPAYGVATYRSQGLVKSIHFEMRANAHHIKVPIETGLLPDFTFNVQMAGRALRSPPGTSSKSAQNQRPAYGSGQVKINVDAHSRTLKVKATPNHKELSPGSRTTVHIQVEDARDAPVPGAEVALLIVDEAILAVAGHLFKSPIDSFYRPNAAGVSDLRSRDFVLLKNPKFTVDDDSLKPRPRGRKRAFRTKTRYDLAAAPAPEMTALATSGQLDASAESSPSRKTTVRTRFDALAFFAGSVPTDAEGRARIVVRMPDSLTRYRVVAYAAAKANKFGLSESTITVRKPMMVRPSPPRFLNYGDRAHLPIVIQNLTTEDMQASVALDVRNLERLGPAGQQVTVPAKDRVEIVFPVKTMKPGQADYQVVAASGPYSDAQKGGFPVLTPATTEAFATYGVIDSGTAFHKLDIPAGILDRFGGLQISTSATALQELTDAFIYLVDYPFSCSEQIASRVLSIAAMKDVVGAFDSKELQNSEQMDKTISKDLEWLETRQAADGGIPFWRAGARTWPFLTVHVAHAVSVAKQKGYDVPDRLTHRLIRYLERIDSHMPNRYSKSTRHLIKSYALYVLSQFGREVVTESKSLLLSVGLENLPLTSLGFLLPILRHDDESKEQSTRITDYLLSKLSETTNHANFVSSSSDDDYLTLHSNRRLDAILLSALISAVPDSDAIPKLVRGLLSHRKQGRWNNTQENVFVLLALDRYFQAYEKSSPDFKARVWVGNRLAGKHDFRGRSATTENVSVPMNYLTQLIGQQPIALTKDGPGRLYYRLGLDYAVKNLSLKPVNHGFAVSRRYESIDHPDDVRLSKDGSWRIKAGSRVRVRLSMFSKSRRYHVALVDPLPAGLEAVNFAIKGRSRVQTRALGTSGRHDRWRTAWHDHQNLRDERIEAFASILWAGGHEFEYIARATTPGAYRAAPTKAEEMYHPETFGRGQSDRVVIE